ncbi:hypothetical protein [Cerasicoccus frondis]|uniref:hypothetical protein n=1 Tax=Cerasicoccus frondis TaxID=490090 RepID=UPI00285268FF|nr:hypothetical protein [Cerasicoccus frondis]
MPNRILRDWTDSLTVGELAPEAERFFVRLIMKADDFGRFHGDERLLKAALFPLLTDIRLSSVRQWRDECVTAGLLALYQDERERKFVEIKNFNQRTRAKESRFPEPGSQLAVKCPSRDRHVRTETETYTETRDGDGKPRAAAGKASKARASLPEIKEFCDEQGIPEADAEYLYHHWTGNGWMNGGKKIKDWKATIRAWEAAGYMPSQKQGTRQAKGAAEGGGGSNHREPREQWRDCAKACYSAEADYWEHLGWPITRIQDAPSFFALPVTLRNLVTKHAKTNRIQLW